MKQLLKRISMFSFCLFQLLLISKFSFSQEWAPIGATWYYNYTSSFSKGYIKIESIKDTILKNQSCKILKKIRIEYTYPGYFDTTYINNEYTYSENNKIYFFRNDRFHVLYDFDSEAGDSLEIYGDKKLFPNCDSTGKIVIDSLGKKIINNDTLKVLYSSRVDKSNWEFTGIILQKIGCLGYMFPVNLLCDVGKNEGGSLRCYSESTGWVFNTQVVKYCDEIMNIKELSDKKNNELLIYPNPFQDELFISLKNVILNRVRIYDIYGKFVKEISDDKNIIELNLNYLVKGVYFIKLYKNDNFFKAKIIIKK